MIDEARTGEGLDIVKYNGGVCADRFQHFHDAKNSQREATGTPRESGILDHNTLVSPGANRLSELFYDIRPPRFFPRDAMYPQLNVMRLKRSPKVAAIHRERIRRFVAFAKKSEDGHQVHFSTRKLPRKRASMPELKKVRMASVGV